MHNDPEDPARWTHAMCDACWFAAEASVDAGGNVVMREASRVVDAEWKRCCFCGGVTRSGIFKRADPDQVRCRGRAQSLAAP